MAKNARKSKKTGSKQMDGRGGGGPEGLQVNWYVVGGAVVLIGALIFFSMRQQQQAQEAAQATQTAVALQAAQDSGSAAAAPAAGSTAGCTSQSSPCPPMSIDVSKQYTATVTMKKGGQFVIHLLPAKAPVTVNSFVYLANKGFFNGVTFHRVLEGFMAQGGDPTGTGTGGPGYEFINENSDLTFDKAGVVAMANAGPNTNGSQFFITFGPTPNLNGGYTIFGQVVEGMDVVNGITRRDPQTNPTAPGDAMDTVTISVK